MPKYLCNDWIDYYRPDSERSAKLLGPLSREGTNELIAEVKALMNESLQPITVYIKSDGGRLDSLEKFLGTIRPREPGSKTCKLITVGCGVVRSAAAFLLVLGDNAYIENSAQICFHGVKCDSRNLKAIKYEDALGMMIRLDRENRKTSRKLAKAIMERIASRRQRLVSSSSRKSQGHAILSKVSLQYFADQVNERLGSDKTMDLVNQSFTHAKAILSIAEQFPLRLSGKPNSRTAVFEAKILKSIISNMFRNNPSKEWLLNETVLAEIMSDYHAYRSLLLESATDVDNDSDGTLNQKHIFNEDLGFWYYANALCRQLLIGEHTVSAQDAYWLGLVDEVLETNPAAKPLSSEPRIQA